MRYAELICGICTAGLRLWPLAFICEGLFYATYVLLLDEATLALDSALAKELLAGLKRDFPHLGVLMIMHQEELKFIFDKVIGIDKT